MDPDSGISRVKIRQLLDLIPPKINLREVFKVGQQNAVVSDVRSEYNFVIRGMVVYYGKHYWAYFYSQKFDIWFQFDDSKITNVGNF